MKILFYSLTILTAAQATVCAQFENTYYDRDHFIFYYENGSANNPGRAQDAYVINSDGEVLHKWEGGDIISPEGTPGYLLENGLLLRGVEAIDNSAEIFATGAYGILQMVDKDGNVVWEFNGCSTVNDPANGIRPYCLHHDVEPMPNGNILASMYVTYTEEDAIAELGFAATGQGVVTMDELVEIRPDLENGGGEIVWRWRVADHLIQDRNAALPNFGVIADSPGRFDINSTQSNRPTNPRQHGDHIHINAISYNPERDEILFSFLKAHEIYIIDHNLTTEEAATPAGDFLWRWGNPENYDYGGGDPAVYESWRWTRGQHDARWLFDGSGNITLHNNNSINDPKPSGGMFEAWTEFFEIELPHDIGNGGYLYTPGQPFGPASPMELAEYDPDLPLFNDGFASGGQKLANGHVFTGSSPKFTLLEHDENGEIVWFFDCRTINPGGGQFYKPQKYPIDYPGFRQLGISGTVDLEFSLIAINPDNGTATVSFRGDAGLLYNVQATGSLRDWLTIVEDIPGKGELEIMVIDDPGATPSTETRFYRLVQHD